VTISFVAGFALGLVCSPLLLLAVAAVAIIADRPIILSRRKSGGASSSPPAIAGQQSRERCPAPFARPRVTDSSQPTSEQHPRQSRRASPRAD